MKLNFKTGFGIFLILGCFFGFFGYLLTPTTIIHEPNQTIIPHDIPTYPYGQSTGEIDFRFTIPTVPLQPDVNYTIGIQMVDKYTFEPLNSNETIWVDFHSSTKGEMINKGFLELNNGYAEFTIYSEIDDFILMTIEAETTTEYYYIIIGEPYFEGVEM